jgi:hypothetical protein
MPWFPSTTKPVDELIRNAQATFASLQEYIRILSLHNTQLLDFTSQIHDAQIQGRESGRAIAAAEEEYHALVRDFVDCNSYSDQPEEVRQRLTQMETHFKLQQLKMMESDWSERYGYLWGC